MSTARPTTFERLTLAAPAQLPSAAPAARMVYAGPAIAVAALALALMVTSAAGVPLRDPDGVASGRLLVALGLVAVLVVVDIAVRASRAGGGGKPTRDAVADVARTRWNRHRVVPVCMALFAFFATYFAYRNLKSVVPLLREDLFDTQLRDTDLGMFFGRQPAEVLHDVLGTGISAHVLSSAYLLLFLFIPATLALSLVFSTRLEAGLFYSTALALNWVVGAGSYFVLPSLGPFELDPQVFVDLPNTAVAELQSLLLRERAEFLAAPTTPGAAQSIGAFASLHVSIFVTGALAAHLLGMRRAVKALLWALTGITVISTIYFGWHYVLDDVGGIAIAVISLYLAAVATGFNPLRERT